MKIHKTYFGVGLPKNQAAMVDFLQTGSNDIAKAYTMAGKKTKGFRNYLFFASYFNRQLKKLQKRNLFLEMPFVYKGIMWLNPGVNGSKANYESLTLHDAQMELKAERSKII